MGARLQSAPTTSEGAVVADDVDGRAPSVSPDVDPASVVVALKAVLDSDAFRPAWRARDFLAYVVTETLQGRGDQLSERTVARWALGRGPAFDGRNDSSVRVQARRVRQGLDDYYAGAANDEVRIVLPTGTYVPEFVRMPWGRRPDRSSRAWSCSSRRPSEVRRPSSRGAHSSSRSRSG